VYCMRAVALRVAATPGSRPGNRARFEQPGLAARPGRRSKRPAPWPATDVEERPRSAGRAAPLRHTAAGATRASAPAGHRPMARQARAAASMAARMARPTSWAWRAWSLRGSPRNTTPKTLTKQAAAKPPMRARAGKVTSAPPRRLRAGGPGAECAQVDEPSLTKPLSGGSHRWRPNHQEGCRGLWHPSVEPASESRCRVPEPCSTLPAP